ncbi:MAG: hypothetical protein Q7T56_19705 [Nocardioidaceae bacterium]|nr:hypothetical protein [Nocardioidaceae bacterium]
MTKSAPGARWIRAALQVNPYAYKGKNEPSSVFASEDDYNKALLDECEALGISLIAITDHWCVDSASGVIAAAAERNIVALPGFEANSSEGVHILVIFEAGTELSKVNAAIGACGVEPGCANGTTGDAFKKILERMTDLGALVIPAHINVPNSGMLTGRSGPPLVAMVKDPNLHAVAITPSQTEGTDQELIVKGAKPYDRRHPLAVVHADDIVHPDQLKTDGATSWFKVSSSRMESLKLAVRTPETRVSLSDPTGQPRAMLRKISWTGGFLDGVTVPLSSDLTALIGGRGTGKSTVIESLRYALGLVPIGGNAAADHKAIVDKVLRSGTVVRVEVETVLPTPRRFTIERVVPNPPVVRDTSGTATNQQPLDVAGMVEVFGQHELAELAGSPESVAEMLHRFAGTSGTNDEHEKVLEKLAENRQQLQRTEEAQVKLKEELADIPRLEERVKHFNETDVAKRLEDLERLSKDESVFVEASQRTSTAAEAIRELSDPQLEASLVAEYEGRDVSPQKETLQRVVTATAGLAVKLKELAEQANAAVTAATTEIGAAKADWESAVKEQRDGHAEVLRKLHEEGMEPDKYLDATKALGELKAKEPRLASYDDTLNKLQKERGGLLGQLAEHERGQAEELHKAVRAANAATGGVVVVRPIAAPERSHIIRVITEHISGPRTQIMTAVGAADFSPRSFVAAVRGGSTELEKLGIRGAQATNLIGAGEPLLRELEEMAVGHAVEVLLDISSNGGPRELKTMDELSKGQRATALLLLLLGASTAPLVIDQPEDDLDNRFVYDGVVAHLRKLKGVRQIITSTHNANVPVLGDAELIVALEGDGQNGRMAKDGIGSLDDAAIRSLAENILEGGPAAFNARHHLYGF